MTLKLYGVPLSPFARMAHAVAELTNNEYEYIKESLSFWLLSFELYKGPIRELCDDFTWINVKGWHEYRWT